MTQNTLKASHTGSCFLLNQECSTGLVPSALRHDSEAILETKELRAPGVEEVVSRQREVRAAQPHSAAPSHLPRGQSWLGGGKLPRFLLKAPAHFLPGASALVSLVDEIVKRRVRFIFLEEIKFSSQFPGQH